MVTDSLLVLECDSRLGGQAEALEIGHITLRDWSQDALNLLCSTGMHTTTRSTALVIGNGVGMMISLLGVYTKD